MKKLMTTAFTAALLAASGFATGQNSQQETGSLGNAQSGHKDTGGNPVPGLGTPAAGTPGSTGGSHTPGTSASGAAVKCPQRTMEATNGSNSNLGTGKRTGPMLSQNRPSSVSTFCEDEADTASTASTASGTNGSAAGSRTPSTSGTSAKEGTAQSGKK